MGHRVSTAQTFRYFLNARTRVHHCKFSGSNPSKHVASKEPGFILAHKLSLLWGLRAKNLTILP